MLLTANSLQSLDTTLLRAWIPNFALLGLAVAMYVRAARIH